MRIVAMVLALVALLGTSGGAQTPDSAAASAPAAVTGGAVGGAAGATVGAQPAVPSGPRLPPPATTRAYVHVFLAFGIAFLLFAGYVVMVGRRFARIEEEIGRPPL